MSQVKNILKMQEGNKTPAPKQEKQYGHLWVDGIDYGNSEEVYNAFANHARSQALNQGKFYDQWLTALRNGQDVVFGNGNTVNLTPEGMSEKRAGSRSDWTKFWDDTFNTERNQFSDAIATARRFTYAPTVTTPTRKKYDFSKQLILDYNKGEDGNYSWSNLSTDNLDARQRIEDIFKIIRGENPDYEIDEDVLWSVKNAYDAASKEGDANTFLNDLWNRIMAIPGYANEDAINADKDLDWLRAFNIIANPYGTNEPVDTTKSNTGAGGSNKEEEYQKKIKDLEAQLQETQKGNDGNGESSEIVEAPLTKESTPIQNLVYSPFGKEQKPFEALKYFGVSGVAGGLNAPSYLIRDAEGKYYIYHNTKDNPARAVVKKHGRGNAAYLYQIDDAYANKILSGEIKFPNINDIMAHSSNGRGLFGTNFHTKRGIVLDKSKLFNEKEGGVIDYNKVNALVAKNGGVIKAQSGISGLVYNDQFITNPNYFGYKSLKKQQQEELQKDLAPLFGQAVLSGNKPISAETSVEPEQQETIQNNWLSQLNKYGDTNIDSTPGWNSFIEHGLGALDYAALAWGRKKVHDRIEKGLKDSLYKETIPRLQGVNVATPYEDAMVDRYDQYIRRGLTTPLTSDNIANTQNVLSLQLNALQGRDQAVRQQSQTAFQRQTQNQQIANQQAQLDANAENNFRARLSALRMGLAQNDASLYTQQAQSFDNLVKEWRAKFDKSKTDYNKLAYQKNMDTLSEDAERIWNSRLNTYKDANGLGLYEAWNKLPVADQNKYADIYDWLSKEHSDVWRNSLEREYNDWQKAYNNRALDLYAKFNMDPALASLYRTKYGIVLKSGGKVRNRYKNEPWEDIWINQNKAAHASVAKLNDNIIKTFLKTLK